MSKKKYEITIKISFIHCFDVLSYCFISILLVFSISCLVLRIAHHTIIICLDKKISIFIVSHNGHEIAHVKNRWRRPCHTTTRPNDFEPTTSIYHWKGLSVSNN